LGVVLVSRCASKRRDAREHQPRRRARRAQRPAVKPRSRAAERWNACENEGADARARRAPRKRRAR
jgi:hypothetical protein